MAESSARATARIYQFPIRDRTAKSTLRDDQRRPAEFTPVKYSSSEFGSCWYHEAAALEEQASKRSPR